MLVVMIGDDEEGGAVIQCNLQATNLKVYNPIQSNPIVATEGDC